jgi:hypothetical protein
MQGKLSSMENTYNLCQKEKETIIQSHEQEILSLIQKYDAKIKLLTEQSRSY